VFEIEKSFSFEAGHQLIYHDGKCSHPHGHSYILKVTLLHSNLIASGPKKNMVTDFSDISTIINPMIDQYFDHHWLNDTLQTDSPTAEFIAHWIFCYLKPHFPYLKKVTIFETPTSSASYFEIN
jgi:6-pyruvoyltetrahydropterin/6-carboxytetrahydropterin synthase